MAKCKSFVHTTIRGSIGGRTYTSSPYAEIMARCRVIPNNPQSTYQQYVRNGVAGANDAWETLTDVQRGRWDDYAATVLFPDPIKDYTVPGRLLAIGSYVTPFYHNALGLAPVIACALGEAPTLPGRINVSGIAVAPLVAPGVGFNINFTNLCGESIYVYAARSMACAKARNRWSGPFLPLTTQRVEVADQVSAPGFDFTGLDDGYPYFVRLSAYSVGVPLGKRRCCAVTIVRATAITTV